MSRPLENDLLERMVASVIVAVGTRYVVEVERELLLLRMQILEKGSELGNIEVLDRVSDRLTKVSDQMQGMNGIVRCWSKLSSKAAQRQKRPDWVARSHTDRSPAPVAAKFFRLLLAIESGFLMLKLP